MSEPNFVVSCGFEEFRYTILSSVMQYMYKWSTGNLDTPNDLYRLNCRYLTAFLSFKKTNFDGYVSDVQNILREAFAHVAHRVQLQDEWMLTIFGNLITDSLMRRDITGRLENYVGSRFVLLDLAFSTEPTKYPVSISYPEYQRTAPSRSLFDEHVTGMVGVLTPMFARWRKEIEDHPLDVVKKVNETQLVVWDYLKHRRFRGFPTSLQVIEASHLVTRTRQCLMQAWMNSFPVITDLIRLNILPLLCEQICSFPDPIPPVQLGQDCASMRLNADVLDNCGCFDVFRTRGIVKALVAISGSLSGLHQIKAVAAKLLPKEPDAVFDPPRFRASLRRWADEAQNPELVVAALLGETLPWVAEASRSAVPTVLDRETRLKFIVDTHFVGLHTLTRRLGREFTTAEAALAEEQLLMAVKVLLGEMGACNLPSNVTYKVGITVSKLEADFICGLLEVGRVLGYQRMLSQEVMEAVKLRFENYPPGFAVFDKADGEFAELLTDSRLLYYPGAAFGCGLRPYRDPVTPLRQVDVAEYHAKHWELLRLTGVFGGRIPASLVHLAFDEAMEADPGAEDVKLSRDAAMLLRAVSGEIAGTRRRPWGDSMVALLRDVNETDWEVVSCSPEKRSRQMRLTTALLQTADEITGLQFLFPDERRLVVSDGVLAEFCTSFIRAKVPVTDASSAHTLCSVMLNEKADSEPQAVAAFATALIELSGDGHASFEGVLGGLRDSLRVAGVQMRTDLQLDVDEAVDEAMRVLTRLETSGVVDMVGVGDLLKWLRDAVGVAGRSRLAEEWRNRASSSYWRMRMETLLRWDRPSGEYPVPSMLDNQTDSTWTAL